MTIEIDDPTFYARRDTDQSASPTEKVFTTADRDAGSLSLLETALQQAETAWWIWELQSGEIHWPHDTIPLDGSETPIEYETFLESVHPSDRERVDAHWRAIPTGDAQRIEYRLLVNSEVCWLAQDVTVEDDEADDPGRAIGILREITDRKRRERELQSFREAVEHSGHSIYWTDRDGAIQYVNPAFEETTGFSQEEAVGETPAILSSGAHGEAFYEDLWSTISSGEVWTEEVINERKTGEQYTVSQTISPIEDEHGRIDRFVAVNTDITEQKERERELEILRQAVEDAPFSIVLTDPTREDNPIVYVNDAFEELTGYSEAEALGRNWQFLQGNNPNADKLAALQEAIDNEEAVEVELRNYRKDGTMFWNRITVTPIFDEDGNLIRYLGTQQDVSKHREREQRLAVLNRVLRHNLRNKLSAITTSLSTIESDLETLLDTDAVADPPADDHSPHASVDRLENCIERIDRSAEDLETVGEKARRFHEAIDATDELDDIALAPILRECVEDYAAAYPAARIDVSTAETTVRATPRVLRLTVGELLENALTHTGTDEPTVSVTVTGNADERVSISVADNGRGIPEIEQTVSTASEETPLLHGSGFGLWMVNWLVSRIGGDVTIAENDPTGTVVTVTLPSGNGA